MELKLGLKDKANRQDPQAHLAVAAEVPGWHLACNCKPETSLEEQAVVYWWLLVLLMEAKNLF